MERLQEIVRNPTKMILMERIWVAVVVLTIAATVGWYGWFAPPYLTYNGTSFEMVEQNVKAGGVAIARVDRCNRMKSTQFYFITRKMISLDTGRPPVLLPSAEVSVEPGCATVLSPQPIPQGVPPGRYYIAGKSRIPGIIRDRVIDWGTAPFNVVF